MTQKKTALYRRMIAGNETLCIGFDVEGKPVWWLEPSSRTVRSSSAQVTIDRGLLRPAGGGLLGEPQQYEALSQEGDA